MNNTKKARTEFMHAKICREIAKSTNVIAYCYNDITHSWQAVFHFREFCTIIERLGYKDVKEAIRQLSVNGCIDFALYKLYDCCNVKGQDTKTVKVIILNLPVGESIQRKVS